MRVSALAAIILATVLAGCERAATIPSSPASGSTPSTASEAPEQKPSAKTDTVQLKSGKSVKVLGVGKLTFPEDTPALMLKYQTGLSIDDKAELQKEVEEIWVRFKIDAENGGYKNAIISANEIPKGGFISSNRSFNFVFKKSEAGTWEQVKKQRDAKGK